MSLAHSPILGTLALRWPDETACARTAAALARHAPDALADAIVRLDGPLGAGKTTFARHLLRALGVAGRVRSPTYTLLEPYEWAREANAPVTVSHFDFYRFEDPDEWSAAGFRDVFAAAGLKLVEWADKVEGLMPTADLSLDLAPDADEARGVTARAHTARGLALLAAIQGGAPDADPASASVPA